VHVGLLDIFRAYHGSRISATLPFEYYVFEHSKGMCTRCIWNVNVFPFYTVNIRTVRCIWKVLNII